MQLLGRDVGDRVAERGDEHADGGGLERLDAGPQDDQHAEKAEHDRARAAQREALAEKQHREQRRPTPAS